MVVFDEPSVEIGLPLVERAIDLFAERKPVELVEHGPVEPLADAVIWHDDFGAPVFAPSLSHS